MVVASHLASKLAAVPDRAGVVAAIRDLVRVLGTLVENVPVVPSLAAGPPKEVQNSEVVHQIVAVEAQIVCHKS